MTDRRWRTLRVATYNIHKGVTGIARRVRVHDVRQGLHTMDADIVFLQEVQGRHERHAARHEDWPAEPRNWILIVSSGSQLPKVLKLFSPA
mgnify:CR=1 FL=1